ncbi:unnamed protein product [Plutella xylostella]|uniref:(diamondback moth) hypothetical protein n=1 Tax=Plutella xylostella TaxID=51655 RepID=A0A8S4DBQ4_PLUXY|nr:unnamed protein product [Plutella xylostella]
MDKQKQVDVVYTDFEKAFDRVDHIILIRKLEHLGIHGDLLRWVESYLNNRSQAVALGGFCSDFIKITSGVPQGKLADMSMLYDLVRGRGDPALLAQLGLLVPSSRTRHTQLFRIPYHRVNYTQNTTLTRIAKTYNNIFSDVDPFICSKLTFKKSIIEHLNEH